MFKSSEGRRGTLRFAALVRVACQAFVPFLILSLPAQAIVPQSPGASSSRLTRAVPSASGMDVQPDLENSRTLTSLAGSKPAVANFMTRYGGVWEVRWDRRADQPNLIQGSGIPLFAGSGNTLAASTRPHGIGDVQTRARKFLVRNQDLLGIRGIDLRLDEANSTPYGNGGDHWFVQFDQYHDGVKVLGASIFVRISHGNVVQFGNNKVVPVALTVDPVLGQREGLNTTMRVLPFKPDTRIDKLINSGELVILPRAADRKEAGLAFAGSPGTGYDHVLAWHYVLRVRNDQATYDVYLDANAGTVLKLGNLNVYADAQVTGNVYTTDHVTTQAVGLPFAAVNNGGAKVTDLNGTYDYSGGTASVALDGKYFRIVDNCGAISLSDSSDGNLDLGSNAGTDCATPGFGGAGNTNASRSAFYNLTLINRKAITYFPSNSWLQSKVTAEVNENDTCNAFWDGTQLNFFLSSASCANTGEIPGVFLHEWGHGMDTNTGGAASEYGSGEAVGDTFAMLETHESCIGMGFYTNGSTCYNCNTPCTGVRDVRAFSLDAPPGNVIASPATIADDNGVNADRLGCPYFTPTGFAYQGPMGYEGHQESYIASGANWDLAQALIGEYGQQGGWQQMNRIWYGSLVPSKSAYQVVSGGKCNVNAEVNGCGANNWYTVYLAADDDDGNLANGTPNACRIWDAFEAHGIACGTRPTCSPVAPDFYLQSDVTQVQMCAGSSTDVQFDVGAVEGFSNAVTLSTGSLASGLTASFAPNPVSPGNSSTMTIGAGPATAAGSYTVTALGAASGSAGHAWDVGLDVFSGHPQEPTPVSPANASGGHGTDVNLSWSGVADASSYTIEVATDSAFANVVDTASGLTTVNYKATGLDPNTVYYWRVTADNICGGTPSVVSSFVVADQVCSSPAVAIPDNSAAGVSDVIHADSASLVGGLRVKLVASHSWVGDLSFTLAHGATTVGLLNRPGKDASNTYGCDGSDVDVTLDDAAATSVQDQCNGSSPAIAGDQQPYQPLAGFDGQAVAGDWTLTASDGASGDTGTFEQWCLVTDEGASFYTVGGSVSGMDSGKQLTLQLNTGNDMVVAHNGSFEFPLPMSSNAPYAVTVLTAPPGQSCDVISGSGTIATANVTDVSVTCVPAVDEIFADGFEQAPL